MAYFSFNPSVAQRYELCLLTDSADPRGKKTAQEYSRQKKLLRWFSHFGPLLLRLPRNWQWLSHLA
jgi:hypothetical protein